MLIEPGSEEWGHFVRQANRKIEAARRAGLDRSFYDMLELMIGGTTGAMAT